MKWFKHETDALMSEGIARLMEQEGFAGLGRWYRLLEIVASKMDESDRCSVSYPISQWCSFLGLKQKKLISFLELIKNELKTKVECSENIIRIEIPNLLNKRDNYSRHLQVSSRRLASIDIEVEVDKDIEKKREVFSSERKPLAPSEPPIAPALKSFLAETQYLKLTANGDSGKFWQALTEDLKAYGLGPEWLFKKLRLIEQWQADNPGRASRTARGMRQRIRSWIDRDTDKMTRRKTYE